MASGHELLFPALEPGDEPEIYLIREPDTFIISTDYHTAKLLGRALAYFHCRAVNIRCGQKEALTVRPEDHPLAALDRTQPSIINPKAPSSR